MTDAKLARAKIKKGESARAKFERVWAECDNFFAGEQTLLRRFNGELIDMRVIPPHIRKMRHVYNLVTSRIMRELAAYTALGQDYQVDPAPPVGATVGTVAHQSAAMAAVDGERQLLHFEDDLDLAENRKEAKQKAINFGEAYIWPLFDSTVGKAIGSTGKYQGNVAIKVLDPTQVAWEDGMKFKDSPWHSVECFYTPDEMVANWPDSFPTKDDVKKNAKGHRSISDAIMDSGHGDPDLVSVHHYLERPMAGSKGKHLILTGDKTLHTGDYPYEFDETANEPWLVRYIYIQPDRRSRGKGMLEDLIDPQRSHNRKENLLSEWTSFAGMPMVNIPRDIAESQQFEIQPGQKFITTPGLSSGIEFVQPGNPPQQLMDGGDRTRGAMDSISGQYDFTQLASSAAAQSIKQIVDQDKSRQGEIARSFARSDSKVAIRLLLIARKLFTEPRELRYQSKTGQSVHGDFVAAKRLPKRINVRVKPGQPLSRGEIQATATQWGQMGWTSPPRAMLAIQENNLELITAPFKLNISRQQEENGLIYNLDPKEIRPMVEQFAQIMAEQMSVAEEAGVEFDPSQASPPPGPWPHAQPEDDDALHMQELDDWMTTREFMLSDPAIKQVARWHKQEHETQKAQKAQAQMVVQEAQAQALGAQNAARPGSPTQMPNQPSLESNQPQEQAA